MLPRIALGRTDIVVSRLGLGTVKFGRNQGVKYPKPFELPEDQQLRQLLTTARDLGINLLDTAPAYGASEERLGKLLRGQRQDWILSSKAGETFSATPDGLGESHFDFSPSALRLSLEHSLRHLQTDYLDILLIHSDGNDLRLIEQDEVLHTLAEFKREGWIRAFGMSTKTLPGAQACVQEEADVVMAMFTPDEDGFSALLDQCATQGTGVLLKKIFENGHMLSNANKSHSISEIITQQMQRIFSRKAVNSAIIGTLDRQHLRTNVDCALAGLAASGY